MRATLLRFRAVSRGSCSWGPATAGASLAAVRFQGSPPPTPDVFVFARGLAYTFLFVYGIRAAAVFMIVSSTIGLRTRTLPRWLVFLGYLVALVLLFSVSYSRAFVFVFPAWVTAISVMLLLAANVSVGPKRNGAPT